MYSSRRKVATVKLISKPVFVAVCCLIVCGVASAGMKSQFPVSVTSGFGFRGSVADTRALSIGNAYIRCFTTLDGSDLAATCDASDGAGNSYLCTSTDPKFISIAQSVTGDSYVWVRGNTSGTCTYIQVQNGSLFTPKVQ